MAKPDWEAIESAYRAGLLSLREIGGRGEEGWYIVWVACQFMTSL
ncbi:hypothetical protein BDE27_0626 [Xenorhabdus ehlersii]|uniref:Phage protein n=1 Tax=Xenorhabdus ehlersii TaxID=290111 RepID=A0A2D0IJL8_9GAMM|nr:phage protein [Xenorhabdus ehlersii]RKE92953.1 hypothetical protein BDE27_0626 [Xenorhabdus ehlersii]